LVCDDKRQLKAHKIVLSACSTVFKGILENLPENNSVIYLRGIHHQEMESILEFMYLGVATFYQDRMQEFLNVAKSLEIKEISKDVEFDVDSANNRDSDVQVNEINPEVGVNTEPHVNEQLVSSNIDANINHKNSSKVKTLEREHVCIECDTQFSKKCNLRKHIQSVHKGVKYACTQCDYQGTQEGNLKIHIQSKHEGIKYSCNQCDHQTKSQVGLKVHIQSIHEGVKYSCNQCDHQATTKSNLKSHVKSKHN